MDSALKVKIYEKPHLFGAAYPAAVGFYYRLAETSKLREDIYVIEREPREDDGPGVLNWRTVGGNGHLLLSVRTTFRNDLGTENPTFDQIREFYAPVSDEGPIFKHVARHRR